METGGVITGYIDAAQLLLYLFWLFFFGLVYYLLQESKREGYPLESDEPGEGPIRGFPDLPATRKTFLLPNGGSITVPRDDPEEELSAKPAERWRGAPLTPTGDPMLAGIGPGSWSNREDHPDITVEGQPKIVPLRSVDGYSLHEGDTDPTGFAVVGADGVQAGRVTDLWVEQGDPQVRFIEMALDGADEGSGDRILIPKHFAKTNAEKQELTVDAVLGAHFALAPKTAHPEQITLLEEDKVMAFYGGGLFYAEPERTEPLLL
ncbi:MAG: photosynthetic reaction center subunit H [Pseudomonadota bacterium]